MTEADPRLAAIAEEQDHLDRVHARVEVLRRQASAEAAAAEVGRLGSTFQARYERDVLAHHHATRAARFAVGDFEALVFGRLDTVEGDRHRIGRLYVADDDGTPLLLDWRAPAAAPFYRATAADPMDVARRRVVSTRAREVVDVDDEILDVEAADRAGLVSVTGQGALLAALERDRTPHLQDIVATIRGDQDRIIRTPAVGTLIVTGGPGTGKTVVALHRVAYLLYEQRERLAPRGVLVVGPSRAFTDYTSRVLPSLGEDRVVQRPLAALGPAGIEADGWDTPDVAVIKGDLRMVELCRRLVAAALPAIPPETRVAVRGVSTLVTAASVASLRERQFARIRADVDGGTYNARRATAEGALRELVWRRWLEDVERIGQVPPESRADADFDELADDSPTMRMLWRCYWPEVSARDVLLAAVEGRVDVAGLARDLLSRAEVDALERAWRDADGWRVDDVAILDEIDALLGPATLARPSRESDGEDERGSASPPPSIDDVFYREFGHVVVDEAQDLSPLQWRSVARRGSYATWTVVGDMHQRARTAAPSDWDEVARLIGRRQVRIEHLDVNYRTPAEVAPIARAVLAAGGHDPDGFPRAVRRSGVAPRLIATDDPQARLEDELAVLLASRTGMVAVVAQRDRLARLRASSAAPGRPGAASRLRWLEPRATKGLEFDDVLVVSPEEVVDASDVGWHDLYVVVTRATRSLTVLTAHPDRVAGVEAYERVDAPA